MDVPTLLLLMLLNHGYFWWAHALSSTAELCFLVTNENSAFWFSIYLRGCIIRTELSARDNFLFYWDSDIFQTLRVWQTHDKVVIALF